MKVLPQNGAAKAAVKKATTVKRKVVAKVRKQPSSLSRNGAEFIARFEGFRSAPYNDPVGYATVGFGHLIRYGPVRPSDKSLTYEQALNLLMTDAAKAEAAVSRLVKVPLSQAQYDALVSFTFNCGAGALGSSSLLRELNQKNYRAVPSELAKWDRAGGKVLAGLQVRREAEGTLFAKGLY